MDFLTAAHTDAGTRKKTNQDSMLIMRAETAGGHTLFASVCDGVGGLARGEAASAAMVHAFAGWFENDLPVLLQAAEGVGFDEEKLWMQWTSLIDGTNRSIGEYGRRIHASLGTTAAGVLIVDSDYYIVNVGDSRVYLLADQIYQLTRDQTYVQREIDCGRMTCAESLTDPHRGVLLQCVGASRFVRPVFSRGKTAPGNVFLLCSDGFCHVIAPGELYQAFHPARMTEESIMKERLAEMTGLNIARREDDNISAILVKLL
ncbi:MAG: serine/threonine-protein phosphatase [Eubacteriales bacterium]|nr:serine/threonine-protein phosphatase [Eubacteriales bacterium]